MVEIFVIQGYQRYQQHGTDIGRKAPWLDKDVWIVDGQITSFSIVIHQERSYSIDYHLSCYSHDYTLHYTTSEPRYYG